MNFKKYKEGYMRGLEGRKEREKLCNYSIISKKEIIRSELIIFEVVMLFSTSSGYGFFYHSNGHVGQPCTK